MLVYPLKPSLGTIKRNLVPVNSILFYLKNEKNHGIRLVGLEHLQNIYDSSQWSTNKAYANSTAQRTEKFSISPFYIMKCRHSLLKVKRLSQYWHPKSSTVDFASNSKMVLNKILAVRWKHHNQHQFCYTQPHRVKTWLFQEASTWKYCFLVVEVDLDHPSIGEG